MEKKYVMLSDEEEPVVWDFLQSYRIKALKDFGDVHAGDLGGWIESEKNLSHEGDCWVYDTAEVSGKAHVSGNAKIKGKASVFGEACVRDEAIVDGEAKVGGNADVMDNAHVGGKAWIMDYVLIREDAVVLDADVKGWAMIGENGYVANTKDYLLIGPFGKSGCFRTYYKDAHGGWVKNYFDEDEGTWMTQRLGDKLVGTWLERR